MKWRWIILGVFLAGICFLLGSAIIGSIKSNTIHESGYFQYKILELDPKQEHLMIVGLTESGKQQTALVIPEEIEGIPVWKLGKDGGFMYTRPEGLFESEVLEKVYVGPNIIRCRGDIFSGCPNLQKILLNNSLLSISSQFGYQNYDPALAVQVRFYQPITSALQEVTEISIEDMSLFANVTYYWNYPDSPEEGIFFLDDVDGTVIDLVPEDPKREGYVFAGWFKEPECLNAWDFENEVITGTVFDDDGFSPYVETALYANWE